MQEAPVRSVFSEITDFLATNPTPEEIIAYRLPDDLQARAHELLELNREGELTHEEQNELSAFVYTDTLMSLFKAKVRLKLDTAQQQKVLEFMRELERPRGVPAQTLLKFARRIALEDLERMEQAMEDCERIDPVEW